MLYFAYGSNMSLARLEARISGVQPLGHHLLNHYDLRFHKAGQDGSGKADAYFTGDSDDVIHGVLYRLPSSEKQRLDEIEGVGRGYDNRIVTIRAPSATQLNATLYVATEIDPGRKPYSWYVNHLLVGARQWQLPKDYVHAKISGVPTIADSDHNRDLRERAIYRAQC